MVEPEVLRVLEDLEPHPPRILDEGKRKEPVDIPPGRRDRRPRALQVAEHRIQIRHREPEMVDHAPRARAAALGLLEDESRGADQHAVVTPVDPLAPDVVHVPLRGLGRVRDGEVHMVVEERLRLGGRRRGSGGEKCGHQ